MEQLSLPVQDTAPLASDGNVTEIVLRSGATQHLQPLIPMLTRLNDASRWLTCVNPPADLLKAWRNAGISGSGVQVLRPSSHHSAETLARRALDSGTSGAVVAWLDRPRKDTLNDLERASAAGDSHCIVIRYRDA